MNAAGFDFSEMSEQRGENLVGATDQAPRAEASKRERTALEPSLPSKARDRGCVAG